MKSNPLWMGLSPILTLLSLTEATESPQNLLLHRFGLAKRGGFYESTITTNASLTHSTSLIVLDGLSSVYTTITTAEGTTPTSQGYDVASTISILGVPGWTTAEVGGSSTLPLGTPSERQTEVSSVSKSLDSRGGTKSAEATVAEPGWSPSEITIPLAGSTQVSIFSGKGSSRFWPNPQSPIPQWKTAFETSSSTSSNGARYSAVSSHPSSQHESSKKTPRTTIGSTKSSSVTQLAQPTSILSSSVLQKPSSNEGYKQTELSITPSLPLSLEIPLDPVTFISTVSMTETGHVDVTLPISTVIIPGSTVTVTDPYRQTLSSTVTGFESEVLRTSIMSQFSQLPHATTFLEDTPPASSATSFGSQKLLAEESPSGTAPSRSIETATPIGTVNMLISGSGTSATKISIIPGGPAVSGPPNFVTLSGDTRETTQLLSVTRGEPPTSVSSQPLTADSPYSPSLQQLPTRPQLTVKRSAAPYASLASSSNYFGFQGIYSSPHMPEVLQTSYESTIQWQLQTTKIPSATAALSSSSLWPAISYPIQTIVSQAPLSPLRSYSSPEETTGSLSKVRSPLAPTVNTFLAANTPAQNSQLLSDTTWSSFPPFFTPSSVTTPMPLSVQSTISYKISQSRTQTGASFTAISSGSSLVSSASMSPASVGLSTVSPGGDSMSIAMSSASHSTTPLTQLGVLISSKTDPSRPGSGSTGIEPSLSQATSDFFAQPPDSSSPHSSNNFASVATTSLTERKTVGTGVLTGSSNAENVLTYSSTQHSHISNDQVTSAVLVLGSLDSQSAPLGVQTTQSPILSTSKAETSISAPSTVGTPLSQKATSIPTDTKSNSDFSVRTHSSRFVALDVTYSSVTGELNSPSTLGMSSQIFLTSSSSSGSAISEMTGPGTFTSLSSTNSRGSRVPSLETEIHQSAESSGTSRVSQYEGMPSASFWSLAATLSNSDLDSTVLSSPSLKVLTSDMVPTVLPLSSQYSSDSRSNDATNSLTNTASNKTVAPFSTSATDSNVEPTSTSLLGGLSSSPSQASYTNSIDTMSSDDMSRVKTAVSSGTSVLTNVDVTSSAPVWMSYAISSGPASVEFTSYYGQPDSQTRPTSTLEIYTTIIVTPKASSYTSVSDALSASSLTSAATEIPTSGTSPAYGNSVSSGSKEPLQTSSAPAWISISVSEIVATTSMPALPLQASSATSSDAIPSSTAPVLTSIEVNPASSSAPVLISFSIFTDLSSESTFASPTVASETSSAPVLTSFIVPEPSLTPLFTSSAIPETSLAPVFTSFALPVSSPAPVFTSFAVPESSQAPVLTSFTATAESSSAPVFTSLVVTAESATASVLTSFAVPESSQAPVLTSFTATAESSSAPVFTSLVVTAESATASMLTSFTIPELSESSVLTTFPVPTESSLAPVLTSFTIPEPLTAPALTTFTLPETSSAPVLTSFIVPESSLAPVFTSFAVPETSTAPALTTFAVPVTSSALVFTSIVVPMSSLAPVFTSFAVPESSQAPAIASFTAPAESSSASVLTSFVFPESSPAPVFTSVIVPESSLAPVFTSFAVPESSQAPALTSFTAPVESSTAPVLTSFVVPESSPAPVFTSFALPVSSPAPVFTSFAVPESSQAPVLTSFAATAESSPAPVLTSFVVPMYSPPPVFISSSLPASSPAPVFTSFFVPGSSPAPVFTSFAMPASSPAPAYTSFFVPGSSPAPVFTSFAMPASSPAPAYTSFTIPVESSEAPVFTMSIATLQSYSAAPALTSIYFSPESSVVPIISSFPTEPQSSAAPDVTSFDFAPQPTTSPTLNTFGGGPMSSASLAVGSYSMVPMPPDSTVWTSFNTIPTSMANPNLVSTSFMAPLEPSQTTTSSQPEEVSPLPAPRFSLSAEATSEAVAASHILKSSYASFQPYLSAESTSESQNQPIPQSTVSARPIYSLSPTVSSVGSPSYVPGDNSPHSSSPGNVPTNYVATSAQQRSSQAASEATASPANDASDANIPSSTHAYQPPQASQSSSHQSEGENMPATSPTMSATPSISPSSAFSSSGTDFLPPSLITASGSTSTSGSTDELGDGTNSTSSKTASNGESHTTSDVGLPGVIAPSATPTVEKGQKLVRIGFKYPLNYPFVASHPLAAAQIFEYLPQAVSNALDIDESKAQMKELIPWKAPNHNFLMTMARLYVPAEDLDTLQKLVSNRSSNLYQQPNPTVNALCSLIDDGVPLTGDYGGSASDTGDEGETKGSNGGRAAAGAPGSLDQIVQPTTDNSTVSGLNAGIVLGTVGGAIIIGGLAVISVVAMRHRRQRRHPPVDNRDIESYHDNFSDVHTASAIAPPGRLRPSNVLPASVGTGAPQISRPMMTENSLGWQ